MVLTDRVMQYWNSQTFIGKKVKVVTGTSSADQEYAILVTSGVWYACRVFVADMSPQVPTWPFGTAAEILWWKLTGQDRPLPWRPPVYDLIINTHCFTMNGVDKFIDEMQTLFDKPSMDELKKYLPEDLEVREVPSDWGNNPDKYLKPGDVIMSDFYAGTSHAGIYIGDGKVSHMSGHGQGKAAAKCRVGNLVGDFVHEKTDALRLGIRKREIIAAEAERMAKDGFRTGEYNIIRKNCQHLAMLCATGWDRFQLF